TPDSPDKLIACGRPDQAGAPDTAALELGRTMQLRPAEFIEPCLPTISRLVPTGPQWAYEIKHDGFRFLAVRQGKRVRGFSRGGHDWSTQLPSIQRRHCQLKGAICDDCLLAFWEDLMATEPSQRGTKGRP